MEVRLAGESRWAQWSDLIGRISGVEWFGCVVGTVRERQWQIQRKRSPAIGLTLPKPLNRAVDVLEITDRLYAVRHRFVQECVIAWVVD